MLTLFWWRRLVSSGLVVGLFLLLQACTTVSESGRQQLLLVSDAQVIQLGADAYKQISAKEKPLKDKRLVAKVKAIGQRIAAASGKRYNWEFKVFDSPQVNAFCLPGGKIGVYSGILKVAENEAGLAAILGHEVAHATARHSAERMSHALIAQGVAVAAHVSLKPDNKYRTAIMAALGVGLQVGVMLPYGRTQESESDHIGTIYMARAGYDPQEAVYLWHRMAKARKGGPPEFLSTHPDPNRRAGELQSRMGEYKAIWQGSAKRPSRRL